MRLLTYNIHKGIGGRDRRYRLDRVIEVIEHENPDLFCLQEVSQHARRSAHDDQARILIDYFHAVGHLYQRNHGRGTGGYGNLVLSRWPLTKHHQISLRYQERKLRGAQMVVVDTPEGPLHLVNWHLGLAEVERHWQVNHLLSHALFRESADLPTLIVGDTNDWRNTLAHGPFSEHLFQTSTAPPSRFRTFPAWMALGSLDKIFHRGRVTVRHARVISSHLARRASDHLPLVIDFHLQ
ncbi:MAG TPA: endonuclease/exonuclease/phosphatase family protein [Pirellulales bacterium]|nr:endonuclease/exonuclease/phosphatase family protein [Pirellulales bacterium]